MLATELRTARMLGTRPTDEDLPGYEALLLDPRVEQWLRPDPLPAFTTESVLELLVRDQEHWRQHEFGPWALRDRETGAFLGRAGLSWTTATGAFAIELPWAIVPERWGEGLATEAAQAAVLLARALAIPEVVSFTLPANTSSRRVMEKAGLLPDGTIQHAGLEHVLYRLPEDPEEDGR